jgi:hypothetical protein
MKNAHVREAIKNSASKKTVSTKYCQNHCVEGIEYNGKIVCAFCRSIPGEIIHYQIEQIEGTQKTVFYKKCPLCGDIVKVIKEIV